MALSTEGRGSTQRPGNDHQEPWENKQGGFGVEGTWRISFGLLKERVLLGLAYRCL